MFSLRRRVPLAATLGIAFLAAVPIAHAQQTPAPPTPPVPAPPAPVPAPVPVPDPKGPPTPIPDNPPAPTPAPGRGRPQAGGAPQGRIPTPGQGAPSAKPKPYSEVITGEAKTDNGLFKSHQVGEKYYWEIPTKMLGKEMLWVTTFRQTQTGYGYGGTEVQDRVVRWEKRGDQILLRSVDYQARAHDAKDEPLQKSLALASVEPILLVFDIKAYNDKANNAPVVDITPTLTSDNDFSARRQIGSGAYRTDASRSFIDRVKSLPTNIEIDVLTTYVALPGGGAAGGGRRPAPDGPQPDRSIDAVTVVLHHSIVLLPETPMKARLEDDRIGFFSTSFYDFGNPENRVKEISFIDRWRLEKKDPSAALSEPIKPITYYIGPEVPAKWRPYLKQAVEDWQVAFEKAGFKNAIIAKDAPTKEQDPDFDPDDVRYSVIRWLPSTTENAYGPHIVDPRSGEILNADVKVFENVLKLNEAWYFTQASPNDSRAQKLPLPDDLIGDCLRYVISHEIGHTLGFPHNMKASSSYTVAQLRSPAFVEQNGDEASIMDYGRFNYVTQPGDGVKRLIPKIGPYDMFATEWGYSQLDAPTPEAEKPMLDKIARRQETDPTLRFGHGPESSETDEDPTQQTEDLGSDPVAATALGLKNIDRVMSYLVSATVKPGENYDMLDEMFAQTFSQRQRELNHVVNLVGGIVQTNYHYETGDPNRKVWNPVPAAKQKEAVSFLMTHSMQTPTTLLRPDILSRIGIEGVRARVLAGQRSILSGMLTSSRTKRMADLEAQFGGKTPLYTIADMMEDVRRGVWSELSEKQVVIDPFRRDLQRTYVDAVASKLRDPEPVALPAGVPAALAARLTPQPQPELRPAARAALAATKASIKNALARTTDQATRLHLLDMEQVLQNALYPKS